VFVFSKFSIFASPGTIVSSSSPSQVSIQSQFGKSLLLLIFACLAIPQAFAACHTVTPSGSGSKTGADWNNAYAGLPSTLVRGDIYYLADGNYGHVLNLSTPASGTSTIELRKAQSYDNCTSAGWNTATMGSSQAVWNWSTASAIVNFSSGYWIINGNGQNAGTTEVGCGGVNANPPATYLGAAPNAKACGIKIDDSTCNLTTTNGCNPAGGVIRGGGPNITWESVEWFGQGLNSNGNNNSEPYFWFASGGSFANTIITHSYIHNMGTTAFTVVSGGWQGGSFDHNYAWGEFDGSVNHGESVQLQGNNGTTSPDAIHHNIWRDQQTNGDIVATDISGGTQTMIIYDNADFCSQGGTSTTCRHNDGVIGCFGNSVCKNYLVYNNTWSFPGNCGWNISSSSSSSMTVKNNLWFNCSDIGMIGGATTVDYNSYLNSNQSAVGSHDLSTGSVTAPFVVSTNVRLTSENAAWENRTSLGAPYDTLDLYGNPFSNDRGASEVGGAIPSPPTNLSSTITP
jgi:hypothetical protein